MSEVRTFFRFCPACGKRFHIKLQEKKLMDEHVEKTETTRAMGQVGLGYGRYMAVNPVIVEEKVPITIEIEDFAYSYKCKHCGHIWSEMREEERKLESSGGNLKKK